MYRFYFALIARDVDGNQVGDIIVSNSATELQEMADYWNSKDTGKHYTVEQLPTYIEKDI